MSRHADGDGRSASLFWLLMDGLSYPLHQQLAPLLAPGIGLALPLEPLSPNCQTPPSLFSIWSGLDAHGHGLTGYDMPAGRAGDPLATVDSFECWPRQVPMVWDRWARAGGHVRTSAVPFVQPQRLQGALLSHTDVYARPVSPPQVLKAGAALQIPTLQVHWRVSTEADAMVLHDTPLGNVRVPLGTTGHIALPAHLPAAVAGEAHRALAVHAARVAGEPVLCFLGFQPVFVHGRDAQLRRRALAQRACSAGNPGKLYAAGALGPQVDQGGDGAAELLLLDLLQVMHQSFLDDILWALCAGGAQLTVGYYPVMDLASHQLLRHLHAPQSPAQHQLAGAIRHRLAHWLCELLGRCQALLPPGGRFVAHSDHGMSPLSHDLCPNSLFKARGWLAVTDDGAIDSARSLLFYHPAENGWLALHPQRMAQAGLPLAAVVQALDQAFDEAVAPAAQLAMPGGASSRRFALLPGPQADAGDGWVGHWYLQPPRGTRLRQSHELAFAAVTRKGGDHTCWADDPWLQGVLLEPQRPAGARPWALPLTLMQLAPALMADLEAGRAQPAPLPQAFAS